MARLISDDALAIIAVWGEARGEPYNGKVGVAEVIWRRTQQKYNSDGTVAGTCLRAFQFSCFNPRDPNRIPAFQIDDTNALVLDCVHAWQAALDGSNLTHDAVLYYADTLPTPPPWAANATEVARIGHHIFLVPNT